MNITWFNLKEIKNPSFFLVKVHRYIGKGFFLKVPIWLSGICLVCDQSIVNMYNY